jgi:hypothetical protein
MKKIDPAYMTNWSNLETNQISPLGILGRDLGPTNNKEENLITLKSILKSKRKIDAKH